MNYPAGKFYDVGSGFPSASILIQVFSSLSDRKILESINDELIKAIPDAIIFGSTSVGEIMHGLL